MSRLKASFWENGLSTGPDFSMEDEDDDDEEWEREVVGSLESLADVSVDEG